MAHSGSIHDSIKQHPSTGLHRSQQHVLDRDRYSASPAPMAAASEMTRVAADGPASPPKQTSALGIQQQPFAAWDPQGMFSRRRSIRTASNAGSAAASGAASPNSGSAFTSPHKQAAPASDAMTASTGSLKDLSLEIAPRRPISAADAEVRESHYLPCEPTC